MIKLTSKSAFSNMCLVQMLLLVSIILFSAAPNLVAQTVVKTGTRMRVANGTFLVSTNDITIEDGGDIDLYGTLKTTGDIVSEEVGGTTLGETDAGVVILNGSSPQTLEGGMGLASLVVNNSSDVIFINGGVSILDTLTLIDGYVMLGDNHLYLDSNGLVQGSGLGSQSFVVTNGTGEFRKNFYSGAAQDFAFPIGSIFGSSIIYSPANVSITNATSYGDNNFIGARVTDAVYPDPNILDNYLTRYWTLSAQNLTGLTFNASFQYIEGDVVTAGAGVEADIVTADVSDLPWVIYNSTDATLHRLSASGLTTGGSFTGVDAKVYPPMDRIVSGSNTISNSTTTCFSAEENLTVGGTGNAFLVENGGAVDLIAGTSITLLPGTHVVAGGFMHAYISTSFCAPLAPPPAPDGGNQELTSTPSLFLSDVNKQHIVKLFPNPTKGNITMEVINPEIDGTLHFELYNMSGNRIRAWDSDNRSEVITLCNYPMGIYLLHVFCGEKTEVARIIKTN